MKPPFETESEPPKESLLKGQENSFATLAGKNTGWTLAQAGSQGATNFSESVASFPEIPGFQIHSELGQGGMGVVYEATQTNLNRRVAIKLMLIDSKELTKRFQLEATALAKIQNAGIVEIFDVGTVGKCPFLVMELLLGGTLAKAISGHQVDSKDAASLTLQMARALVAIHGVSILHRDLKPGNVILVAPPPKPDPYGKLKLGHLRLKLCDFGLAKKLDHDSNFKTQTGAIMGTPGYMAPEQAMGGKILGPTADIFSLGAILYEMLAGVAPFRGETLLETIHMTVEVDPVSLSKLRGGIPVDLETICLKCLEKQPSRRYPSAQALCQDLEAFLGNKPIKARPARAFERSWKWCKRNPTLAASLGLITSGLLIFLTLISISNQIRFQKANENLARLQDHLGYVHLLDHDVTTASVWYAASAARQADPQSRLVDRLKMGSLMDYYPWIRSYVNHEHLIQGAQWSPSGNLYLTFGDYRSIQVHDPSLFPPTIAKASLPILKFPQERIQIRTAQFLADDSILTQGEAKIIHHWDWKNNKEPVRIGLDFTAMTVQSNGKAVALAKGKKVFVDPTGTPGPAWNDDRNWPEAIAPIEELAFLGSSQRAVLRHAQSLSLANFEPTNLSPKVTTLNGIDGPITCMATSPDGSHFAAGNLAGEVALFSTKGKNMPTLIQAHTSKILCLRFSPNGKFLASGGDDLLATVVDVDAGRIQFQALHEDKVSCVSFTNDNTWLLTGSNDNGIRGWHTISGRPTLLSVHCNGGLTFVHSHPTQRLVLTGSKDNCCRLWDYTPKNRTLINFFAPVDQWVFGSQNSIAIRQGTKVRVGSTKPILDGFNSHLDRFVPFDDITYQKSFRELPVRAKTIATLGNSGFVVMGEDRSISLWNVLGEKVTVILHPLPRTDLNNIPDANITSSADGNYLVIEGSTPFGYKSIALYHLSGPNGFTQISLPDTTMVTSWAFSPTGSMLAWGNRAGNLKIASLQDDNATLVEKVGAHSGTITAMAFSHDSLQIATGGNDMFLRLWNTSQPDQPLWKESEDTMHASAITVISFHNHGGRTNLPPRILTGSDDNFLRIFDSKTGRQTAPPMPHSSSFQTVQSIYLPKIGPSGMNIAGTSTTEGVIYLWDLDSGEILSPLVSIPGHDSFFHGFLAPDSEGRPVFLVRGTTGFLYANRMMTAPSEFTDKQLLEFAEYNTAAALDKVDGTSLNPISAKELVHRGTEFWKTFGPMFPPLMPPGPQVPSGPPMLPNKN